MEMKDEILAGIQQNMRIESVRGEAQPDAPYGPGPKAALEDALELGRKLGFKVGQADNRIGWVEYGEGKEMVGVLGHVDVVPAGDTGWTYPAYGAEIHDGILWGRGCLDDKGPIIGSIYALKAIRDLNLPIDRRIRVIFGSDEECGSSCAAYYVENGYEMPRIGFTPDADFPDIFCEKGVFTVEQSRKQLKAAQALGFGAKLHADEIVSFGGAELAGELKALSADHLLQASDEGIKALAQNNVVATLLPLTAFTLKEPYARGRKMIDSGCAVALATDLNPGSCFSGSIPLTFALACIYMKLTVAEAITAITLNGAAALGRADRIGSIEAGKQGDFVLLGTDNPHILPYYTGMNAVKLTIKGGRILNSN